MTNHSRTAIDTLVWLTHDAFEGRPLKLTAINLGNELVTIMAMGLIIGLLGP